ncbi:MAG: hypothetical protein M1490_05880 [Candidatus Bathyarchaeota archaeon]|nr:hypothetical protein [Candidatus Bathyarchaeota archaeon]
MNAAEKKSSKPSMYQVLLLVNNESQDVSVQEAEQVDFCQVKEHLQNGGSVFITSNDNQKIHRPKTKAQLNYVRARRNVGFIFRQQMRS